MPIFLALVGVAFLVVAYENTYKQLFSALGTDVPSFAGWFAALLGVGALGYVPGLQTVSRYLLALVILALVLKNYSKIFSSFTNIAQGAGTSTVTTAQTDPAQAYVQNPSNPQITSASFGGTASNTTGNINAAAQTNVVTSPLGQFNPQTFLAEYESGSNGFGGTVA